MQLEELMLKIGYYEISPFFNILWNNIDWGKIKPNMCGKKTFHKPSLLCAFELKSQLL